MAKYKDYEIPDELYFHKEHTWAKIEGDKVRIGLDDLAQSTAGDITYVDLPFEGDEVEQGEVCGKYQSSKWIGKLFSPLGGEILEVNSELETNSTLINKDPYEGGWIYLLKPSNLDEELKNLIHGEAVEAFIDQEIERVEREKVKEE